MIKEKSTSCISNSKAASNNGVVINMKLGIESIDKLVLERGNKLDGRGDGDETFINVLADPANGAINENLVSLLWLDCRQELSDLSQAFELKFHRLREILSNIIHTVDYSLAKESIQNFVRHPALKQALSNCMRKNDLIYQASVKDGGFNPLYIRYVNSSYNRHDVPRRILSPKNIAEAPDSDSGPSLSPSSPPDSAPASSPDSEAPDFSPIPSPTESPASSPFPSLPKPSNAPPPVHDLHHVDFEYKGLTKTTHFIACIATALVTAFVAFLFFFLFFRKQINPRPICGDCGEKKLDHQSLGNESSQQKKTSKYGGVALEISSDGKSSFGAVAGAAVSKASVESSDKSGNTNSTKLSGEASTSAPGVHPDNALAGGLDPLPHEPPNPVRVNSPAHPGPPPPPKPPGAGPRPLAPPGAPPRPPPPTPLCSKGPKPPNGPQRTPNAPSYTAANGANASKAKLKPFLWDKVAAKPDHAKAWNQIKSGSFRFNEDLIQSLFRYSGADKKKNNGKKDPSGNELPMELLRTLLMMAPTLDEERKFKTFSGEISQLGPAEQFLKQVLDIPFAFKRMEALLFMCSLNEEVAATKESFEALEVACKDLRCSRLFLKLLEAVLKTGNHMNDGTYHGGAQAFKLDALLKLSDVKGADGKTTLLNFVVQEIIRSEGLKAARVERESESFTSIKSDDLLEDVSPDMDELYHSLGFQTVSCQSTELESVKKAAAVDAENLTGTVVKLGQSLLKARDFLNSEMKDLEEDSGFHKTLKSFMENAC
ncbi:Formin-like protein 5 [Hibiscus syriacus]|uniref:Formin-like protein n=1 Tax=Hibiscus syriacus TaxID=106335 RepID=A0A6A3CY79_HIBSY|nr:Formin-like protein 5 [Hibiscus syriacus]